MVLRVLQHLARDRDPTGLLGQLDFPGLGVNELARVYRGVPSGSGSCARQRPRRSRRTWTCPGGHRHFGIALELDALVLGNGGQVPSPLGLIVPAEAGAT